VREGKQRWRERNREKHNAAARAWHANHREHAAEAGRAYRAANASQLKASKAKSYVVNKAWIAMRAKASYVENPEPAKARGRRRYREDAARCHMQAALSTISQIAELSKEPNHDQ